MYELPEGEWVQVCPEENVEFRMFTQSMPGTGEAGGNGGDSKLKEQIVFELRKAGPNANETLDAFIQKAVDWYKAEVRRHGRVRAREEGIRWFESNGYSRQGAELAAGRSIMYPSRQMPLRYAPPPPTEQIEYYKGVH